ncbi:response regulator [Shewanella eurypsychrophilus]|uniref:Response regulator n=1 Tax=Shewanella eurypsychrophilus TaxID=2593656 RepID=A0ABX6VBF6_9GAMM|nr:MULTISPECIES: response regulator [Shewanella]QFU24552.1 response regulator [Shewanella sp. YLB-09]QPG59748.1 response regulator [Shewanella eurypsychrophilus]
MKILIADDDRVSRQTQKRILSRSGEVDTVVNGAEAVQKFKHALEVSDPYHLICLDISMPFFDGKYALEEIRKIEKAKLIAKDKDKEVKVVMVTSSRAKKDILQVKGKCNAYLLKPISISAIEKMLSIFKSSA